MHVGVLGPAEVSLDGAPVDLGTRKQRALLAALALHRGRAVAVDTLVDLLWADRPPAGVTGTLQAYVAGLRRALEPNRPARAPSQVLVTVSPGYALQVPAEALDVTRFEVAVSDVHQALAPVAGFGSGPEPRLLREELSRRVTDLANVLALWRGTPFIELEDAPAAAAERVRLEELRLVAIEDRATAELALGNHATVAAELEALTASYPLRERLWALRALALTRSGRQADALDVLQQVRRLLSEELGLEPGAELRALQTAVLRQDPALDFVPLPGRPALTTAVPSRPDARSAPPRPRPVRSPLPWPLVGREHEMSVLTRLLDDAEAGTPSFGALVGEPGMGKSRLSEEVARIASERGMRVLVGRCSQDEGAPPLWPWANVLAGLDKPLPVERTVEAGTEDESARFRAWDDICATLLAASTHRALLVVLDDLHWADVSSLRVLGLLLENAREGRLAVLTTWRDKPQPTGALAAVADGLARRHAARLQLAGLEAVDVAEVVEAVAQAAPTPDQARALQSRTDGNPFFVVEYARLVGDGRDLAALLSEPQPPAAVNDVLTRRVERLPDGTVTLLRTASVAGRDFDLPTLCRTTGTDENSALDTLDPAVAAGLVIDVGAERFRFAHALVRDTVYAALSPSRRSRAHRALAEALEGVSGREAEVARHWLATGPAHADRAWRAAAKAAERARLVFAYDEAEGLLRSALDLRHDDPAAGATEEFDLLVSLGETLQLAGRWTDLRPVVHRMIDIASRLSDIGLLARAAVMPSNGALWQTGDHGEVDQPTVSALRRVLAELPAVDSPVRCRALLSLASEAYYGVGAQEREALADEGIAMARRIGDPGLLLTACQVGFVSSWRAATADTRLALAEESIDLARDTGDEAATTTALTVRAVVAGELGDVETMEILSAEARRRAEHRRQLYPLVVLDSLDISWLTMRGDWGRAQELLEHLTTTGERMALPQYSDAVAGAVLSVGLWRQEYDDLLPLLLEREANSHLPVSAAVVALLVRMGRIDEAREHAEEHPFCLTHDDWFSMLPWCLGAESALALGDRQLARSTYALLAPYAGRSSAAGSGVSMGPVDAFLALAAAAVGERELAARHADTALDLCGAWRIPLAAQWLRGQRDRHGF